VDRALVALMIAGVVMGATQYGHAQPGVPAQITTAPFHQYEDAPATPDADDIAIWSIPLAPRAVSSSARSRTRD